MKKLKYLLVSILGFLYLTNNVSALSVSIKSNYKTITKGNNVTVTANVNSSNAIWGIEGTLKCTGAGINTGVNMDFNDSSDKLFTKSFSISFKPKVSGTITCSVSDGRVFTNQSSQWEPLKTNSINITVKEPIYIPPKVYSSNNKLNSLEVEGYALDKKFNSDVKEYSLEVPNDVKEINVKASLDDNKASISGIGLLKVNEGLNKFSIIVTAENGNKNEFILNVTVKELDPIEVSISGKKYTIIRKEGLLEKPENYIVSSIKMGKENVLCYENEITKNIIIGLKDDKGVSKFYNYNKDKNEYTLYQGYKIGGVNINILPPKDKKIPSFLEKTSFDYQENKIDGFKLKNKNVTYAAKENENVNDFYLVYAMNEISGEEGLYVLDKLENTLQRFNYPYFLAMEKKLDNYFLCIIISVLLLAITIIGFSLALIKKSKIDIKFNKENSLKN